MDNNHSNPYLSIFCGSFLGLCSAISDHISPPHDIIDIIFQLIKVISFGMLGGAFGYVGKLIAIRIHKFFKS